MDRTKRVFITGYGSVSPIDAWPVGLDFYDAFLRSENSAQTLANSSVRAIGDFHAEHYIASNELRRLDRFSQIAMVATKKALQSASLVVEPETAERTGIIFNTCFGPLHSTEVYMTKVIREGGKKAPAGIFPYTVHNAFTGVITSSVKALGTNSTVSGCNPVCYGFDTIRRGTDDIMLVGGCEELTASIVSAFRQAGLLDAASPEPYHRGLGHHNGHFILAEGASVLSLEESQAVRRRGIRPLAEILDYGVANTHPWPSRPYEISAQSIEVAMREALERSMLRPSQIDLFASGANGTEILGNAESQALRRVFSDTPQLPTLNVKPNIGETLGAAASFSLVAAAAALSRQMLPAKREPDQVAVGLPQFDLEPTRTDLQYALVNSYELGGNINSIVIERASLETP